MTDKYQYGHFNGMEDIYEYSNNNDAIPQTKYLFVEPDETQAMESVKDKFVTYWGFSSFNTQEITKKLHSYPEQALREYLYDVALQDRA
jgi:hypothetical protein